MGKMYRNQYLDEISNVGRNLPGIFKVNSLQNSILLKKNEHIKVFNNSIQKNAHIKAFNNSIQKKAYKKHIENIRNLDVNHRN